MPHNLLYTIPFEFFRSGYDESLIYPHTTRRCVILRHRSHPNRVPFVLTFSILFPTNESKLPPSSNPQEADWIAPNAPRSPENNPTLILQVWFPGAIWHCVTGDPGSLPIVLDIRSPGFPIRPKFPFFEHLVVKKEGMPCGPTHNQPQRKKSGRIKPCRKELKGVKAWRGGGL